MKTTKKNAYFTSELTLRRLLVTMCLSTMCTCSKFHFSRKNEKIYIQIDIDAKRDSNKNKCEWLNVTLLASAGSIWRKQN